MIQPAVSSDDPVTLVGGGLAVAEDVIEAVRHAPKVVAADGGAALALAAGMRPEAVIGDFDSLKAETRARLDPDTLVRVAEQDSTDFEKALTRIAAPLVLAVGFTGARVDHELAALSTLVAHRDRPCILLARHEVILHAPPRLVLDLHAGATVSLFPMLPVTGRSAGLDWPVDGLAFTPGGRIGTSNRATGGRVQIDMDGPGMILCLPRAQLATVMQALRAAAPAPVPRPAP